MGSLTAPANFEQLEFTTLVSRDGYVLGYLPKKVLEEMKNRGGGQIIFDVEAEACNGSDDRWLTLKEASAKYLEDRPDLAGINIARIALKRACQRDEIEYSGSGRRTRINPTSLDAWRLARRDVYLDKLDEDDLNHI